MSSEFVSIKIILGCMCKYGGGGGGVGGSGLYIVLIMFCLCNTCMCKISFKQCTPKNVDCTGTPVNSKVSKFEMEV